MDVDWVTVAAQILNFAVLVWILQRVLFRPIARALAARAEAVADRLASARAAEAAAQAQAERLREAERDLAARKEAMLDQAREHAEDLKRKLGLEARAAITAERAEWHAQLAAEKQAFLARLRRRGADSFAQALANALSVMADADLIERMATVFAGRIEALDEATAARLRAAVAGGAKPRIRASAALEPATRQRLGDALTRSASIDARPQFDIDPGVGHGLVLEVGPVHLGWTLDDYLDELEADLAAAVEQETGATTVSEAG